MIMLDAPAQSFEVSFPPEAGIAYEQGQQKKDNPER
jgi:hypothetical protein